jgi:tripartite-type tricarboxylate transporter receptor subunit TctC
LTTVITALKQAALRVLQQKVRLASEGAEPAGGTPAQFGEYLKQHSDKYAKLVKTLGLEPE